MPLPLAVARRGLSTTRAYGKGTLWTRGVSDLTPDPSVSQVASRMIDQDRIAHQGRWRALALIGIAQVGAMSTWFSAAAVAPSLAAEWRLGVSEVPALRQRSSLGSWWGRWFWL